MTVLHLEGPDPRRWDETALLEGLRAGEPLALAEAVHRTLPAVHGAAQRLLGPGDHVEALLRRGYGGLWREPPASRPLEAAVRERAFALATGHLQEAGVAPPSAPGPLERDLAALDEPARRAVLLAHDAAVPTWEQHDSEAAAALVRGLCRLAGEDVSEDQGPPLLGDWVLGLVGPPVADRVEAALVARPELQVAARRLRRGRRRLEGLPPAPDMVQRVLVTALTTAAPGPPAPGPVTPPPAAAVAGTAAETAAPADAAPEDPPPAAAPPQPPPAAPPQRRRRSGLAGLLRGALLLSIGVVVGLLAVRLILAA